MGFSRKIQCAFRLGVFSRTNRISVFGITDENCLFAATST